MPVSKPLLPRAQVGRPVTAQAWNDILDGIDGYYDALGSAGRDYVEVKVTFREGPVSDARVVGVPMSRGAGPSGPPVAGAVAGGGGDGDGDGATFRVYVPVPGPWTMYVEAPGFSPAAADVDVGPGVGSGLLKSVAVELTQTDVFVPDVVGFPAMMAADYLIWAGLGTGVGLDSHGNSQLQSMVVMAQGPAPGAPVPLALRGSYAKPTAEVHRLHRAVDRNVGPQRTIVPDLLGAQDVRVPSQWGDLGLLPGNRTVVTGASRSLRVVGQHPAAGELVPANTHLDLTFDEGDSNSMQFKLFPTTHRQLAGRGVNEIIGSLIPLYGEGPLSGVLASTSFLPAPWPVVRRSIGDRELEAMRGLFDGLGAPLTSAPDEGLAAAWETIRVAAMVVYEHG